MDTVTERIRQQGFAFTRGETMRRRLEETGSLADWERFAESWDALEPDPYLAVVGRERRRRHGVFDVRLGAAAQAADRPHFQTLEHNPLQGGIERRFAPLEPEVANSESLQTILREGARTFAPLSPPEPRWEVEVHQFRIEARRGQTGAPTPEGVHRDGVDHVLVLMIRRVNIRKGTTSIHDAGDRRRLGAFTLAQPFDAALVDDRRALHAVTAVEAVEADRPAYRDVLVVTYALR
ncbi:MAG: 2OG-Fe dioxygenase family protein [Sandaracinaceae bacterium]|nr:MAG: hypothetical protein EVA89_09995 [Sandaracinaceae bacterium]